MRKLYFAKSSAVSTKVADRVRKYLQTLNVELKEFKGGRGNYSHDDLLACDSMIILPSECDDYSVTIGKGIYSQVQVFERMLTEKKVKDADDRILVITCLENLEEEGLFVSNFRSMDLDNPTDWTDYATLYVDCMTDRPVKKVFSNKENVVACDTRDPYSSNPCAEVELPNSFSDWYSTNFEAENQPEHISLCFKLVYSKRKPHWWRWEENGSCNRKGYTFTYLGDSRIDGMPTFRVEGSSRDTVEEAFRSIGGIAEDFVIEPIISLEDSIGSVSFNDTRPKPMSPPTGTLYYMEMVYGSGFVLDSHPMKYLLLG